MLVYGYIESGFLQAALIHHTGEVHQHFITIRTYGFYIAVLSTKITAWPINRWVLRSNLLTLTCAGLRRPAHKAAISQSARHHRTRIIHFLSVSFYNGQPGLDSQNGRALPQEKSAIAVCPFWASLYDIALPKTCQAQSRYPKFSGICDEKRRAKIYPRSGILAFDQWGNAIIILKWYDPTSLRY